MEDTDPSFVNRVNWDNESCLFGTSKETFLLFVLCLVKFKWIFDLFCPKGFSISSGLDIDISYCSFIFIVIKGTSYKICISTSIE